MRNVMRRSLGPTGVSGRERSKAVGIAKHTPWILGAPGETLSEEFVLLPDLLQRILPPQTLLGVEVAQSSIHFSSDL